MGITVKDFGRFWNTPVTATVLSNKNGMEAEILNYGCILRILKVPGKDGGADISLGFDTLAEYLYGHPFFGAIAGRVANRIAGGNFTLNGKSYQLACNEAATGQHLHGGLRGFDKYVWDGETKDGESAIVLKRRSQDGEEGYPGALDAECKISLNDNNALTFTFSAKALDQDTIVNMVNHAHYNLGGHSSGSILDHTLKIWADAITPVNEKMIPTGEIKDVSNTPYDFRNGGTVKEHKDALTAQNPGAFFDMNFVLNHKEKDEHGLYKAAQFHHSASNRTMTVSTDLPGIQFYDAAKLSMRHWVGKGGAVYGACTGACFETQLFPDAVHHSNFPSAILKKGETRVSTTVHHFNW